MAAHISSVFRSKFLPLRVLAKAPIFRLASNWCPMLRWLLTFQSPILEDRWRHHTSPIHACVSSFSDPSDLILPILGSNIPISVSLVSNGRMVANVPVSYTQRQMAASHISSVFQSKQPFLPLPIQAKAVMEPQLGLIPLLLLLCCT